MATVYGIAERGAELMPDGDMANLLARDGCVELPDTSPVHR